MATTTPDANDYEPTGDPEHAAYGQDFFWTCSCGASAAFMTGEDKAKYRARKHERYCMDDGEATVRVSE